MSAVRGPFTLRALEGCKVDSRAEPLKINVPQDWVTGSVQKNVAPHGLSPQSALEAPHLFAGAEVALGLVGSKSRRSPGGNEKVIMKAPSLSGGAAVHPVGGGYANQCDEVATAHALAKEALNAASKPQTVPPAAMKTMCTACGVNLKEGHKFCVFCGGPVSKVFVERPPGLVAKAQAGVAAPAAKHQSRGAHNASGVGGATADLGTKSAVATAGVPPASLALGLQMKPRVNSTSSEVPKRKRNSLTTLLEEEFDVELEKEQEVIGGA